MQALNAVSIALQLVYSGPIKKFKQINTGIQQIKNINFIIMILYIYYYVTIYTMYINMQLNGNCCRTHVFI